MNKFIKKGSKEEGLVKEKAQDHNRRVIEMKKVKAEHGWKQDNFNIITQGFIEVLTACYCGDIDNGNRTDPRPLAYNVVVPCILSKELVLPELACTLVRESKRKDGKPGFEICLSMRTVAAFLEKFLPLYTGKAVEGSIWEMTSL